ncbi:hypothetical protein LV779_13120 [Streptomyces thinghirensis]|nr:hypothetical protein [Streptomyces thinghirensis]
MNRPTRAALSALSLLSLAALTACGGDSAPVRTRTSRRRPRRRNSRSSRRRRRSGCSSSPSRRRTPPATGRSRSPTTSSCSPSRRREVTVDKPACAPLALAMNQLPLGEPQADLTRVVDSGGANIGAFTYVTLTTYESGGAESAMSGLSKAVDACGGGFTAKSDENTSAYDSVTAEKPVAAAGDESPRVPFHADVPWRHPHRAHPGRAQRRRPRRVLLGRRQRHRELQAERREAADGGGEGAERKAGEREAGGEPDV